MKIGIIGTGMVGSAAAFAMAIRGIGSHLVLVDHNSKLAAAQAQGQVPLAASSPLLFNLSRFLL